MNEPPMYIRIAVYVALDIVKGSSADGKDLEANQNNSELVHPNHNNNKISSVFTLIPI